MAGTTSTNGKKRTKEGGCRLVGNLIRTGVRALSRLLCYDRHRPSFCPTRIYENYLKTSWTTSSASSWMLAVMTVSLS